MASITVIPEEQAKLRSISSSLDTWFTSHGRTFPWRHQESTLFEKIVTEILVQRTRAETVVLIYGAFFKRFPNWKSLDTAPIGEIQEYLKPIGIWRRRSFTLKSLSSEMLKLNGVFPSCRKEIDNLPGVGQYVGNAIELFAHGKAMPLLDTNMARVIERVLKPRKLADIRYDPWLQAVCKEAVSIGNPVEINWAFLDVGGTLCKPKNPNCQECPLSNNCSFHKRAQA